MSTEAKSAQQAAAMDTLPIKPPGGFSVDDVPHDTVRQIGLLIGWWGYLQMQLGVVIREAIKVKRDTGRVITIGRDISVATLCDMIRHLVASDRWIQDATLRADADILRKAVLKATSNRNDYAHGVFGTDDEKPGVFVRHLLKDPVHKTSPGTEEITAESVGKLVQEARLLWLRAQDITQRLKGRKPIIPRSYHEAPKNQKVKLT